MEMKNTKRIAVGAILIALVIVSIFFLKIPTFTGYIHLGDTFIYLGAMLGPGLGFLIGGISTAVADLAAGYPSYALWSLFIHGAQGLLFALYYRSIKDITKVKFILGAFIIGLCTVVPGYYLAESLMYGSFASSLVGIPLNSLQVLVGSILSGLIFIPLKKYLS